MLEIFNKLGLPAEYWLLSMFAAALAVMYRIVEPATPISGRKAASIVLMGAFCGLIVPGLLDFLFSTKNAFWSAAVTSLVVYCFEPLLQIWKTNILNKAKNGTP